MKLEILNFSFFSKSALGKIFYWIVLGLYTHELYKNAKKRIVISFLSKTLCETAVPHKIKLISSLTEKSTHFPI